MLQHRPIVSVRAINRVITMVWMGLLSAGILSNPTFSYPGRDGGIFLYIGSLILKGNIPYRDVWENKGPLVFYINALGLYLTGGSRWGIWLMEFLFFFGSAYLSYKVLKRSMGVIPAVVGTFIMVITAGNVLQGGNFSEEYSLLFSVVAIFAFLKSLEQPQNKFYALLIGMSLGFNVLLRPNNISVQIAVMAAYLIMGVLSKNWPLLLQRMMSAVLGTVTVLVPAVLYFTLHGALQEMINVVLVFNFQYSEGKDLTGILGGLTNSAVSIGLVFIIPAIAGYLLSLIPLLKREALTSSRNSLLLVLVIGWLLEAFLSTLSGRSYPHYFIGWAPYVGLFSAYVVYVIFSRLGERIENYEVVAVLALMILTVVGRSTVWQAYGITLSRIGSPAENHIEYVDPIAAYIRENTSPDEKVFIWGFRPIINFVSGREAPVSFLPYPLVHVKSPLANQWADQFYEQFTSAPPVLVINMIEEADRERIPDLDRQVRKEQTIRYRNVVLAPNLKEMLNFIDDNYLLVGAVEGNNVYRLKSSLP